MPRLPSAHLASLTLFVSACSGGGGSSGAPPVHDLSAAAPRVALVSPVAGRPGSPPKALRSALRTAAEGAEAAPSLPDKLADIQARLAQTTVEGCLAGIHFTPPERPVTSCYAPKIGFLNHPDTGETPHPRPGADVGCTAAGDGSDPANGCLGGGDLGIWLSAEPSGEACTAATMNAQVASTSSLVNSAVTLITGLACVAQVQGHDLAVGADPLALQAAVNEHLGTSLTTASLQRLADRAGGRPSYRIVVEGAVDGRAIRITTVHSPGDEVGDGAAGLLNGYVEVTDPMDGAIRSAFSLLYEVGSGRLNYELRQGSVPVDFGTDALFTEDGSFDFSAQLARAQNQPGAAGGVLERAEIDVTTGLGALVHAWQAGNGDGYTRVFQAATSAGAAGAPDGGFGYFGFGPPLDDPDAGAIAGMWCNWSGPGAGVVRPYSSEAVSAMYPKVQGQRMARDDATGLFAPVEGGDHITYAPTNSCDVSAAQEFRYLTGDPTVIELQAIAPLDVTNDLVSYGDPRVGVMPALVAPPAYSPTP